jgi:Asp-tRNA(Asn)/Glu-tRNA(Gln) amidotransferase A subunit family amidase
MTYDLARLKAPRLAGASLRAFTNALESPLLQWAILPKLFADAGITAWRAMEVDAVPSVFPVLPRPATLQGTPEPIDLDAAAGRSTPAQGFLFECAADFTDAYREGRLTPVQVAERVLAAIESSDAAEPPLHAMLKWNEADLIAQAEASAKRWADGKPLSPLDGVPIAVKDEMDQTPYTTGVGTTFLGRAPATADAEIIARLRAAGGLMIGKARMVEIGLGVSGLNVGVGTPRNPFDPSKCTGGSSSGSAAAVAAGLCPIAIGADGGGSIRIPAALCGVFGLKATHGRIPETGVYPLCWSVGHVGPIASTARDLALAYAIIAGPDAHDPNSVNQPTPTLAGLGDKDMTGVRIGIYRPWYQDASAEMIAGCDAAIEALKAAGATVHDVELPHLELCRIAHTVTITSEMAQSLDHEYAKHRKDFGLSIRVNLAFARRFTGRDYVKAQRVRTLIVDTWTEVMKNVDLIATPTTGITAPPLKADALKGDESDLTTLGEIMRFAFPANHHGFPAISVPAGYDKAGLPIGLQLHARPWEEHLLLRAAEVVEAAIPRKAPAVHHRLTE